MQFFLDSSNIEEIKELVKFGIIDGITTNPSLIAKTSGDFKEIIRDICQLIPGDVSVEVVANDYEGMIKEGNKILEVSSNIVIKLPVTWDGVRACKYFFDSKVKVNMTLCFSSNQALIAAKAGASYVSPFIGRLDDNSQDGLALISDIRRVFDNYPELNTKILAASVRNPYHLYQASLIGADVATMPAKVIKQLLDHPLTTIGLEQFAKDWQNSKHHV